MINFELHNIRTFISTLKDEYELNYGLLEPEFGSIIAWAGQLALENIANTDSLYHNVDHTMNVTLAGQEILKGKHLMEGGITPDEWLQFMLALLFHDIGYVRGICRYDTEGEYATGVGNQKVEIPNSATDASLTPYHVDRGKLFIRERFSNQPLVNIDKVVQYIEMTRFPPPDDDAYKDTEHLPGLVRAADFIGQLGDPKYLKKIPALYYEFEEQGLNEKIGYKDPGDMRANYAKFFWEVVHPHIKKALEYLNVTHVGRQWIANLHAHVFASEHMKTE